MPFIQHDYAGSSSMYNLRQIKKPRHLSRRFASNCLFLKCKCNFVITRVYNSVILKENTLLRNKKPAREIKGGTEGGGGNKNV